ncbi:MAG: AraC family transcriptional regulator [Spirochaetota bacterium]|nr:AraC family transcriptional regulator [Spirochaetota bacterium]
MQNKKLALNSSTINNNPKFAEYKYNTFESSFPMPIELGQGMIKYTKIRDDLIVFTAKYKTPNYKIFITPEKTFNFMQFGFFISGNQLNCFDSLKESFPYHQGDSIFVPNNLPSGRIEHKINEQYDVMWLIFDPLLIYPIIEENLKILPPVLVKVMEDNYNDFYVQKTKITPIMQTIIYHIENCPYNGIMKKLYLEGKVLELISLRIGQLFTFISPKKHCKLSQKDIDKLHHARDLLIENMVNPPSLIDLAKQIDINLNKLKFGFKELFGTTPFAYLREHRLDYARLLLETTESTASNIASEVGYSDISYFASVFKERFGIYPKSFKKSYFTNLF